MKRILYITRKEFIQIFRDPRMSFIIFIAPVVQLFLFGYAVTTDVKNIDVAIMDLDRSKESREILRTIFSSGYFNFVDYVDDNNELEKVLISSKANIIIVIPDRFSENLSKNLVAELQIIVDGAESNLINVSVGYINKMLTKFVKDRVELNIQKISILTEGKVNSLPIVNAESRFLYNPELKSSVYFVPGVLAMIIMIITMLLTGLAITREREIGTIEQLIVTPVKPYQLIIGKMIPFILIGLVEASIILLVGVWHFKIKVAGSVILLYFSFLTFLFSTLGIALFISTISKTQQQVVFVTVLIMMPSIVLSGLMFPINNMPEPVQYLTYLNPLRYFVEIIRGIILKGNDFLILAPKFLILLFLGIFMLILAIFRFRRTME